MASNAYRQHKGDIDELEFIQQLLPDLRSIETRYHVDGPGNYVIVYMTDGDIRVCCLGCYDEYGAPKPHIKWDMPA